MRILLADTDVAFLELLQSFLGDRGHEVAIACSGLECITIVRDFVPDTLVLSSDLLWGGCDGVIAWMNANPLLPRTPVILISDDDPLAEPALVESRQLAAWFRKPFRLGELLACIHVLARRPLPHHATMAQRVARVARVARGQRERACSSASLALDSPFSNLPRHWMRRR